jgi:hypothetical protein
MERAFADKESGSLRQNPAEMAITACARMSPAELDQMAWDERRRERPGGVHAINDGPEVLLSAQQHGARVFL